MQGLQEVWSQESRCRSFFDPAQGLAHGLVTFTAEPVRIEVRCCTTANACPRSPIAPVVGALPSYAFRRRDFTVDALPGWRSVITISGT